MSTVFVFLISFLILTVTDHFSVQPHWLYILGIIVGGGTIAYEKLRNQND